MDAPHAADGRKLVDAYVATARQELLVLLSGDSEDWARLGWGRRSGFRPSTRVIVRDPAQVRGSPRLGLLNHGRDIRVHGGLSTYLLVADREVAVLARDWGHYLIVQAPGQIKKLVALFEHQWGHARPLAETAGAMGTAARTADGRGEPGAITGLQREILGRLAAGSTDESVAKELGISPRTVQRHVKRTMESLGVRSRFELGMRLAALNW